MKSALDKLDALSAVESDDQFAISLAGFSACAGYLSAIYELLRSQSHLSGDEVSSASQKGRELVVDLYRLIVEAKKEAAENSK